MNISIQIPNSKFVLRSIQKDDAIPFFQMIESNRPRMLEYFPLTAKHNLTLEDTKKYIIKNISLAASKKHMCLLIIDTTSNNLAGLLIFKNIDWSVPKGELAYLIHQAYEGRGIMTRTMKAFMDYAFDFLKMQRIYAIVAQHNEPSVALALRCGLEKEGLLRKEYRSGLGDLKDVFVFAKIREDNT